MTEQKITALAILIGTLVAAAFIGIGWSVDEAWIPQVMLVAGGYLARSVCQIIKEM